MIRLSGSVTLAWRAGFGASCAASRAAARSASARLRRSAARRIRHGGGAFGSGRSPVPAARSRRSRSARISPRRSTATAWSDAARPNTPSPGRWACGRGPSRRGRRARLPAWPRARPRPPRRRRWRRSARAPPADARGARPQRSPAGASVTAASAPVGSSGLRAAALGPSCAPRAARGLGALARQSDQLADFALDPRAVAVQPAKRRRRPWSRPARLPRGRQGPPQNTVAGPRRRGRRAPAGERRRTARSLRGRGSSPPQMTLKAASVWQAASIWREERSPRQ